MINAPSKPVINLRSMDPGVMRALRRRGLSDSVISAMSPIDVFSEYCSYHGLLKAGHDFAHVLDRARERETMPGAQKANAVFAAHCAKRNVEAMAPSLIQALDSIRACEIIADEYQCAA